jgi:glycosyltransferase involved in cell wall biosynthesis
MLRRAIRSVLRQTFADFRVCIYDDASNDETAEVAEEFCRKDSRVEYKRRLQNIGQQRSFVDGANQVETPFFSFLPDDDMMLPGFFKAALEGFEKHPEAAMSVLPTLQMSPAGRILDVATAQWEAGLQLPPEGMLSCVRYGNPGLPSTLIRSEVWRDFGGFDQATWPSDDFDFELRVMARMPVVVLKQPGGIQVMHHGSNTLATGLLDMIWPSWPQIIDKFEKDESLPEAVRHEVGEALRRRLERVLVTHGVVRSLSRGNWDEADRAASLFFQQSEHGDATRMVSILTTLGRNMPGTSLILRGLLSLRDGWKVARNVSLYWQFRSYSELLRSDPASL